MLLNTLHEVILSIGNLKAVSISYQWGLVSFLFPLDFFVVINYNLFLQLHKNSNNNNNVDENT